MDFTDDDIASLGDKLAALDLTAGETDALRTIVAVAADATGDDEVSGFSFENVTVKYSKSGVLAGVGDLAVKLGPPTAKFASEGGLDTTRIINMGDGEEI